MSELNNVMLLAAVAPLYSVGKSTTGHSRCVYFATWGWDIGAFALLSLFKRNLPAQPKSQPVRTQGTNGGGGGGG